MRILDGVAVRIVLVRTAMVERGALLLEVAQHNAILRVGRGAARIGAWLELEALGAVASQRGLLR